MKRPDSSPVVGALLCAFIGVSVFAGFFLGIGMGSQVLFLVLHLAPREG